QWKMMKLETDLVRIPVQYFFHKRMICRATGALVIAKLHQSQFCVFRPAEVAAAFDVRRQWSGCTARHRLVGLTTQKHCSTGCNGNGEKDDDHRLDGFSHALIVAQALLSVRNFFEKKACKEHVRIREFAASFRRQKFLVAIGYSGQGR